MIAISATADPTFLPLLFGSKRRFSSKKMPSADDESAPAPADDADATAAPPAKFLSSYVTTPLLQIGVLASSAMSQLGSTTSAMVSTTAHAASAAVNGTRNGVAHAATAMTATVAATASSALFYAAPRYAATLRGAMAARHDYLLRRLAAERGLRSDGDVDALVQRLAGAGSTPPECGDTGGEDGGKEPRARARAVRAVWVDVSTLGTRLARGCTEQLLRAMCARYGLSSAGDAAELESRLLAGLGWDEEGLAVEIKAERILKDTELLQRLCHEAGLSGKGAPRELRQRLCAALQGWDEARIDEEMFAAEVLLVDELAAAMEMGEDVDVAVTAAAAAVAAATAAAAGGGRSSRCAGGGAIPTKQRRKGSTSRAGSKSPGRASSRSVPCSPGRPARSPRSKSSATAPPAAPAMPPSSAAAAAVCSASTSDADAVPAMKLDESASSAGGKVTCAAASHNTDGVEKAAADETAPVDPQQQQLARIQALATELGWDADTLKAQLKALKLAE